MAKGKGRKAERGTGEDRNQGLPRGDGRTSFREKRQRL